MGPQGDIVLVLMSVWFSEALADATIRRRRIFPTRRAEHLKRGRKTQRDGTKAVVVKLKVQKSLEGSEGEGRHTGHMENVPIQLQIQQVLQT